MQPLIVGPLRKKGGRKGGRGTWKRRFFAVSSTHVQYFTSMDDVMISDNQVGNNRKRLKGEIPWLETAGVEWWDVDDMDSQIEFVIKMRRRAGGAGDLRMRADSVDEAKWWVRALSVLRELSLFKEQFRQQKNLMKHAKAPVATVISSSAANMDTSTNVSPATDLVSEPTPTSANQPASSVSGERGAVAAYSETLKLAMLALVDQSAALFAVSRAIIRNTHNEVYRAGFAELQDLLVSSVLDVLSHLAAASNPFDPVHDAGRVLAPKATACNDILSRIVQLTVRENKGKGGENKAFRSAFAQSLQGVKNAASTILAMRVPDPFEETKLAAARVEIAIASPRINPHQLKDGLRSLLSVVNLSCALHRDQDDIHSQVLPDSAMAVNRSCQRLLALENDSQLDNVDARAAAVQSVIDSLQVTLKLAATIFESKPKQPDEIFSTGALQDQTVSVSDTLLPHTTPDDNSVPASADGLLVVTADTASAKDLEKSTSSSSATALIEDSTAHESHIVIEPGREPSPSVPQASSNGWVRAVLSPEQLDEDPG